MSAIWELPMLPTDKLVMLALADCANDEGWCWPSIATIARKSGVCERSVQRAIRKAENVGLIEQRVETLGRGCKYRIDPRHTVTPGTQSPVTESHRTPDTVSPDPRHTVTLTIKEPSTTTKVEKAPAVKPEHVIEAWNAMADQSGVHKARMTPDRRKKLSAFIRQHEVSDITEAIWAVPASPFLCGENDRGWKADLDFFMRPARFAKLLEGSYG